MRASSIQKVEVEFLWFPFIQRGNLNMLTGDPGAGKSTIICDLAARLSTAQPLPGEEPGAGTQRGKLRTLILNAEDDPSDTIIWRLENQGADLDQIFVEATGDQIDTAYAKQIFDFVRANDIALLVVDPIQAWIGGDADMHRANHTRAWTNQFKALPCTTLFARHMRKSSADDKGPAMYAGLGSIDLTGAVRSEIRASVNRQTGVRTLERVKGNVGPMAKMHYGIYDTGNPRNKHGQLRWGADKTTAAASGSHNDAAKLNNDRLCLKEVEELLVNGAMKWRELRAKLPTVHHAQSLSRAKATLFSWKDGPDEWVRLRTSDEQQQSEPA